MGWRGRERLRGSGRTAKGRSRQLNQFCLQTLHGVQGGLMAYVATSRKRHVNELQGIFQARTSFECELISRSVCGFFAAPAGYRTRGYAFSFPLLNVQLSHRCPQSHCAWRRTLIDKDKRSHNRSLRLTVNMSLSALGRHGGTVEDMSWNDLDWGSRVEDCNRQTKVAIARAIVASCCLLSTSKGFCLI